MPAGFTNVASGNVKFLDEFFIPESTAAQFKIPSFLGQEHYGINVGLKKSPSDRECSLRVKKFIKPFESAKKAQRCFRELQLLKELRHENIVNLVAAYTTEQCEDSLQNVYLVTEYCGQNLSTILENETEQNHTLNFQAIQRMICELLRAVKYLNSAGVIHRDIRPENVAINESAKLTLIDFGFARVIDQDRQMTRDPGSSLYRSIETISFSGTADMTVYNEKVDIWAIGALLCEMIIGTPIFDHKHPLLKALELCGPIPENVLVKIDDKESQEFLRNRSKSARRIDFGDYLRANGQEWLKKDIEGAREELRDFIDRSLVFDHEQRMTVEEALSHPFLSSVRDISREHLASHKLADITEKSISEWKELVWNLISSSPLRY